MNRKIQNSAPSRELTKHQCISLNVAGSSTNESCGVVERQVSVGDEEREKNVLDEFIPGFDGSPVRWASHRQNPRRCSEMASRRNAGCCHVGRTSVKLCRKKNLHPKIVLLSSLSITAIGVMRILNQPFSCPCFDPLLLSWMKALWFLPTDCFY